MKNKIYKIIAKWTSDTEGTTAIEYTFIGAGVGLVLVAGMMTFSGSFNDVMGIFSTYLGNIITESGI